MTNLLKNPSFEADGGEGWREPSHHRCCVSRVERLQEELDQCQEKLAILERAHRENERSYASQYRATRNAVAAANIFERQNEELERELAECHEKLAAAEARWGLARALELESRGSDLMNLLLQDTDHAALDAALEQARAEERERCARIAMATFNPKQPEDADYDCGYNDAKRDIAHALREADDDTSKVEVVHPKPTIGKWTDRIREADNE